MNEKYLETMLRMTLSSMDSAKAVEEKARQALVEAQNATMDAESAYGAVCYMLKQVKKDN